MTGQGGQDMSWKSPEVDRDLTAHGNKVKSNYLYLVTFCLIMSNDLYQMIYMYLPIYIITYRLHLVTFCLIISNNLYQLINIYLPIYNYLHLVPISRPYI